MRVNPGIAVDNNSDVGNIKIYWDIPLYDGVPGKKTHGGYSFYKECYVRTNYSYHYTYSGSATFIHIYTNYPDAWNHSLTNESGGLLREYIDNGYIDVEVDDSVTPNRVEITPDSKAINLALTIVKIGVQVGPGAVV